MARYIVKWDYVSHAHRLTKGQVVELEDAEAEWLQRDSRGVLELVVPPAPEPPVVEVRAPEAPPADRMVRGRSKRNS